MSIATTTYLVETKYVVDDRRAAGGLRNIAGSAMFASKATSGLSRSLLGLGAAAVGGGFLYGGTRAFIGFNSEIEQARIGLATTAHMLQGGSFDAAMRSASGMFEHYQQVAKRSVGETKDFLAMHREIQPVALAAGMSMQKLTGIVEGATVASQVLGERADMVALDVKQMLAGAVTARDRTAQLLLASQKMTSESFNKLSQQQRNAVVVRSLVSPSFKSAAREMEHSFSGVWSTFKDNLAITLGKVGLPLFQRLTAEVQKWNAWIERNPQKIAEFAERFGNALVRGFEAVKGVMSWVVEHKELLLKLAEAALVVKGANMIGNFLGGAGGRLLANPYGAAIGAGAYAGLALREKHDEKREADDSRDRHLKYFAQDLEKGQADMAFYRLKGYVDSTNAINEGKLRGVIDSGGWGGTGRLEKIETLLRAGMLTEGHQRAADQTRTALDLDRYNRLEPQAKMLVDNFYGALLRRFADEADVGAKQMAKTLWRSLTGAADLFGVVGKPEKDLPGQKKQNINVNIHKVEVPAKDPDRWIHDLNEFALRRVRAPTQARAALTGGY